MMLRIVHRTGYQYEGGGASSSYNEARMTPRPSLDQQVLHTRVEISPAAWTLTYQDYWGTSVTAFEVHDRHERLTVTSSATVDVQRSPAAGEGLTWEELRSEAVRAAQQEFLQVSDQVRPPDDLLAHVEALAADADTPREFVTAVIEHIHREIKYVPGATGVHTRAAEAWRHRAGVCQDISNLTIGCLRSLAIPTCYVSGYLMPTPEPQVGDTHKGESHAWIRWWDGAWIGADPTNDVVPGERHVEVAQGREYGDVPPLRGIFTGSGTSSMFVEVELTRLS